MADVKREYVRVDDNFQVRIVRDSPMSDLADQVIDTGQSLNISASGLLLRTSQHLDRGSFLQITFMKPNSFDFFRGRGEVVRVEKNDDGTSNVAVNFLDLSPRDKTTLDYYIKLGKR